MQDLIRQRFAESCQVKQDSLKANCECIEHVARAMITALRQGRTLFFFGNGGSAADSQHIAAEFVGRFQKERQAWPAIALTTDTSILTAVGNDYGFDQVFSRQLQALGRPGDVAVGFSTSGHSRNVILAMDAARVIGMTTVSLTGSDGGALGDKSDFCLKAASKVTARVQETHICIAHVLCELVEQSLVSST